MDSPLQDKDKLKRYKQGDPEILQEVYLVHAKELAAALCCGLNIQSGEEWYRFMTPVDPFSLDDVVQETFVRAFSQKARETFDGDKPFCVYLMAIARNLIIDHQRKNQTRADFLQASQADPTVAPTAKSPEVLLIEEQLRDLYQRFLQQLDPGSRQIWHLRFERKLSRESIQEQTGIGVMRLRVLEQKLRKKLYLMLLTAGYTHPQAMLLIWYLTSLASWFMFESNHLDNIC